MSLEYSTALPQDISQKTYTFNLSDSITLYTILICGVKEKILVNEYNDIINYNKKVLEYEEYYIKYRNENEPPSTLDTRESCYNFANMFLNNIDYEKYPNMTNYIYFEKYDTVNKNVIFYDFYSKNFIDVTTNKK